MTERDRLDAYTVALGFEARRRVACAGDLIIGLFDDVAEGCEAAGSSLIGHIKCHARSDEHAFSCSLTSRRTGTACRGASQGALEAGTTLEVDLAVLVYGLSWEAVDAQVKHALRASEEHHEGRWAELGSCDAHLHDHDAC